MIARIAEGDKEDVDLAVKAARHAFDDGQWPRISGAVCTHNPFFLQFTHSTKLCHFLLPTMNSLCARVDSFNEIKQQELKSPLM